MTGPAAYLATWPSAVLGQADVDTDQLGEAVATDGVTSADWLTAGAILVGSFVLAALVGKAFERVMDRLDGSPSAVLLIRRLIRYAIVVTGLVYALGAVGVRIGPLLGALGIAGIALAFALQDILENFVAGILIQVRRPYVPGDQIQSGDHEGTVRDVNARTVVIDTPAGERVYLPAGMVIKGPVRNLTQMQARRTTLEIGVEYDTDLVEAKRVLVDAAKACEEVADTPDPEALVHEFGASSIVIALRFWHDPTIAGMWAARDAVAVAAKQALDESGITIPFPQSVVTFRTGLPDGDGS